MRLDVIQDQLCEIVPSHNIKIPEKLFIFPLKNTQNKTGLAMTNKHANKEQLKTWFKFTTTCYQDDPMAKR